MWLSAENVYRRDAAAAVERFYFVVFNLQSASAAGRSFKTRKHKSS